MVLPDSYPAKMDFYRVFVKHNYSLNFALTKTVSGYSFFTLTFSYEKGEF